MSTLELRAAELDKERGLDDAAKKSAELRMKKWNFDIATLNALMQRGESGPTEFDIHRLEMCIHLFTYPENPQQNLAETKS